MTSAESLLHDANQLQRDFSSALREHPPHHENASHLLQRLRQTYLDVIYADVQFAHQQGIDTLLWMKCHYTCIEVYRKKITKFQKQHGNARPVEMRKMQAQFVGFVKGTSLFYRSYIQSLASRFGCSRLQPIVKRFKLSVTAVPGVVKNEFIDDLSVRSAHSALVYLGDLSRYRELYAPKSKAHKDWGPSSGYYNLAEHLFPPSGSPHNQIAVIATYDGSLFSATYHFFRALCVSEPFLTARDNLALGFKKAINSPINVANKTEESAGDLLPNFLALHAKIYIGVAYNFRPDEMLLLKLLVEKIKSRTLSLGLLERMVIINIAALHLNENASAEPLLIELCLGTFEQLLKILQIELKSLQTDKKERHALTTSLSEKVSAVARRMLPSLRIMSKWLYCVHARLLPRNNGSTEVHTLMKSFLSEYVATFNIASKVFPIEQLPRLSYPLEEDIDLRGFTGLDGGLRARHIHLGSWEQVDSDTLSKLHPNEEMLMRIADLIEDAYDFSKFTEIGIKLEDDKFKVEGWIFSSTAAGSASGPTLVSPTATEWPTPDVDISALHKLSASFAGQESGGVPPTSSAEGTWPSGDQSMAFNFGDMVDSIVGPGQNMIENEPGTEERDKEHAPQVPTHTSNRDAVFTATNLLDRVRSASHNTFSPSPPPGHSSTMWPEWSMNTSPRNGLEDSYTAFTPVESPYQQQQQRSRSQSDKAARWLNDE